jgi:hypothetical protein
LGENNQPLTFVSPLATFLAHLKIPISLGLALRVSNRINIMKDLN